MTEESKFVFLENPTHKEKKYDLDPGVKPQDDKGGVFKFVFLEIPHTQGVVRGAQKQQKNGRDSARLILSFCQCTNRHCYSSDATAD